MLNTSKLLVPRSFVGIAIIEIDKCASINKLAPILDTAMSKLLFILTFSILVANAFGQVTQIVITSIERTDRTFHKKDELFLENRATKNQIIYTIDTWTKKLTTKEYLIETFYSIWDGDTTIKEQV